MSPTGLVTVSGKAGEVERLLLSSIYPSYDRGDLTPKVQVIKGSIIVELTLAPPDLALNPDQDALLWISPVNISPGTITQLEIAMAYKITFANDTLAYFMGA